MNMSELDKLKEKFSSGDYVCYCEGWTGDANWEYDTNPKWHELCGYKLIHNRHTDIASAVAKDSSVKVNVKAPYMHDHVLMDTSSFFELYKEENSYQRITND